MDGVDDPRHQDREEDVAIKVAPLRNGTGYDGGAGGSNIRPHILYKCLDSSQQYWRPVENKSSCTLSIKDQWLHIQNIFSHKHITLRFTFTFMIYLEQPGVKCVSKCSPKF